MKLNWGYKIMIVYLSFVLMIGFMVYRSSHEHFDLVSEDYYDKEIKYQKQIDNMQNTLALNVKPQALYNKNESVVEIIFPGSISSSAVRGEVRFFKPDNAALDFSVKINLDEKNIQKIASGKLIRGNWKVKTTWTVDDINYYQEDKIYID